MNYNNTLFFEDPDDYNSGRILMTDLINSPPLSHPNDAAAFNYTSYISNTEYLSDGPPGEEDSLSCYQHNAPTSSLGNPESIGVDSESGTSSRLQHSEIEKRRRDNMNTLITELSQMIPLCSNSNRKIDKLTVLRMTVQQLKTLKSNATVNNEASHRPSFFTEEEMKNLILSVAEGFVFVLACDRGRILFVSESVNGILDSQVQELVGQSIFDVVHNRDILTIKENLISSDVNVEERLIDSKTLLPVKIKMPKHETPLTTGNRRSFFCRFKMGSAKGAGYSGSGTGKRNRSESKRYQTVHCTGYIKSWTSTDDDCKTNSEEDDCSSQLACLVMIGRPLDQLNVRNQDWSTPLTFNFKLEIDGKFIYIDHLATIVLGYLPQELIGTSIYVYIHSDNVNMFASLHKHSLRNYQNITMSSIQVKTKTGDFVTFKLNMSCFINPLADNPEFLTCKFTLLQNSEPPQQIEKASCSAAEQSTSSHVTQHQSLMESSSNVSQIGNSIVEALHESQLNIEVEEMRVMALQCIQQFTECNAPGSLEVKEDSVARKKLSKETRVSNTEHQNPGTSTAGQQRTQPPKTNSHQQLPPHDDVISGASKALPPAVVLHLDDAKETTADANTLEDVESAAQGGDVSDSPGSSTGSGDEATMSVLMSLLEADAGLGGPVDFTSIPWPL